MKLVLELVLLNLLRLLCACMLVRFVAADHATCRGPDEAVMPGEMTGGTADESALDASLASADVIPAASASAATAQTMSFLMVSPPDPNREVNTGAAGLFRRSASPGA